MCNGTFIASQEKKRSDSKAARALPENSKKLKEVVKMTPLERIVLDTDCPYLTPEPHRGKRNDSSYLQYVVECISELKGISAEKIIKTTYENAVKMYRIK